MNRLLLDTTLLIDVERAGDDLDLIVDDDDDIAIAAITIAELRVGALLATGLRRARRHAYVDDVSATVPVIGYSLDVAEVHAGLLAEVREQGRPQGAHDLIIAATAKASDRTVVTADRRALADLTGVAVRRHR